jgi:hypothetical protein
MPRDNGECQGVAAAIAVFIGFCGAKLGAFRTVKVSGR